MREVNITQTNLEAMWASVTWEGTCCGFSFLSTENVPCYEQRCNFSYVERRDRGAGATFGQCADQCLPKR